MIKWYNRRIVLIVLHLIVWAIVFFLPYFLRPESPGTRNFPARAFFSFEYALQYLFFAAVFYFNAYWLIPFLLNKKKYFLYTISIVGILICGYFFQIVKLKYFRPVEGRMLVTMNRGLPEAVGSGEGGMARNVMFFRPLILGPVIFSLFFILTLSVAYRFFLDRIRQDRLEQLRQNEQLKSELSFLRSQVSPHFLFNILNSAVSLARTQPLKVEPTLIRLSGLLRYMLYDSEDTKVPLNLEIEYLESYIELQKMRFDQLIKIEFEKEGVLFGHAIEPMLLIPFVENAFKHGLGTATDAFICILLKEENGALYFNVKNKYNSHLKVQHDKYSGIGLANVRKRLDLLHNGNYYLAVNKTREWFEINLKIPLQ